MKYPKMTGKQKKLASKFISEEFKTKKYKPKQAIAIGIARAKRAVGTNPLDRLFKKYGVPRE